MYVNGSNPLSDPTLPPQLPLEPPIDLGSDLDFLREIWALDHALQRRSKRMLKDIGVTGPQRLALRLIGRFPGIPAGRLAKMLHLHPSTVTGVIQRLADRGLIIRRADNPDRRRALLQITPMGLTSLVGMQPTIESAVASTLRELSQEEVQSTMKALRALAAQLANRPDGRVARGRLSRFKKDRVQIAT